MRTDNREVVPCKEFFLECLYSKCKSMNICINQININEC